MAESKTTWWLTSNVAGNEMIANFFSELAVDAHEVLRRDALCADGERRNLWRLDGSQVKHFKSAARVHGHAGLRFLVQEGNGLPRFADFIMRPRNKARSKTKAKIRELTQRRAIV